MVAIRHLRPIAPAVREGHLVTVPPADRHKLNPNYTSALSDLDMGLCRFLQYDPVTRHILCSKLGVTDFQLQGSYTGAELLRSVEEEVFLGVHPELLPQLLTEYGVSQLATLAEASHFWTVCSDLRTQPMVSRPENARHFLWATKLAAADGTESAPNTNQDDLLHAGAVQALSLSLPSLSNLTIDQLVNLRNNEEIWAELQSALSAAASTTAELDLANLQYLDFVQTVRECTWDVVGPIANKLQRDLQADKWKTLAITWSGGGLVRIAVHGIGLLIPPANAAGGAASNATKAWLTRSRAGRLEARKTASTLMLDLSPETA
jgi:hypothetical protein